MKCSTRPWAFIILPNRKRRARPAVGVHRAGASVANYTASIQQITTQSNDAVIQANTGGYSQSQASGYYNANWTVYPQLFQLYLQLLRELQLCELRPV